MEKKNFFYIFTRVIFTKQHKIICYKVLNFFYKIKFKFKYISVQKKKKRKKNRAKEYYMNNRDIILNRAKKYYINNKESIRLE